MMKKNDFATFVVYLLLLGIALAVGLIWIRPLSSTGVSYGINFILLVVLSLVAGILINSCLLEFGHLLGAKAGKYEVTLFSILGLGFKKKDGKKKIGFVGFDGLTGQTKLKPKDVEKSSLSGYLAFPLLFLLLEVIIAVLGISLSKKFTSEGVAGVAWMEVFFVVMLGVGAMIFVYNYFPARLDSVTDGYLMILTSKPVNKVAYNNMLLAEYASENGQPLPEIPLYEPMTDFTYQLNMIKVNSLVLAGSHKEAIAILDKAIETEKGLSLAKKEEAMALKLVLLLQKKDLSEAKAAYDGLSDEDKRYISGLSSLPALRCYLLISGLLEESEAESNYAIGKVEKAMKSSDKAFEEANKKFLENDVGLIKAKHPTWELYDLPWAISTNE